MHPKLQQAVNAVRSGQRKEAQFLLTQVLKEDPGEAQAWFLLSQLVDSEQKRLTYLKKTIVLDPDHKLAAQQLAQLEAVEPITVSEQDLEEVTVVTSEAAVEESIGLDEDVAADAVVESFDKEYDEVSVEEMVGELDEAIEAPIVSIPEAPEPFDTLTEMLEPIADRSAAGAPEEGEKEELTRAQLAPVAEPSAAELESYRRRQVFLTRTLFVLIGLAAIVIIMLLYLIFTSF